MVNTKYAEFETTEAAIQRTHQRLQDLRRSEYHGAKTERKRETEILRVLQHVQIRRKRLEDNQYKRR